MNHPSVVIPFENFEAIGDAECELCEDGQTFDHSSSRILATLQINERLFHVEGISVIITVDSMQRPVCVGWEERLNQYADILGPDGGWGTVELDGREYVLFLEPFS